MKISDEDAILIKNLSHRGMHEGCWVNSPTRLENLESSIVCWRESARRVFCPATRRQQTAFGALTTLKRWRTSCSVWRTNQNTSISSRNFALSWHFLFKCAQDNSPQSPAEMLQTTSCSAVIWSPSRRPSHSLISNLIVCSKFCSCFYNRKLNNK